jgi:hypothetical protein
LLDRCGPDCAGEHGTVVRVAGFAFLVRLSRTDRLAPCKHSFVYGDDVDIPAFLQRPLVARVATNGPTLRPVWYLYEEPSFYWLTDTADVLHRMVMAGNKLVVVVDTCDLETGEVVHVRARGLADIIPVDRDRAMRKLARYLGPDPARWDPRFLASLDLPTTRMCRFTPASMDAADASFAASRTATD